MLIKLSTAPGGVLQKKFQPDLAMSHPAVLHLIGLLASEGYYTPAMTREDD